MTGSEWESTINNRKNLLRAGEADAVRQRHGGCSGADTRQIRTALLISELKRARKFFSKLTFSTDAAAHKVPDPFTPSTTSADSRLLTITAAASKIRCEM